MSRLFIILLILSTGRLSALDPGTGRESVSVTDFMLEPDSEKSMPEFDDFIKKLEKKRGSFKSEKDFIRYIFIKTHNKFLKKYETYVSFDQLFVDGTYNCLTGTILYSLILKNLNIDHQVIETNYHIFLMTESEQGEVLIEATDPIQGFVSGADAIAKRIDTYKSNSITIASEGKTAYQFKFNLFNKVSQQELLGLLYYNQAVQAFNDQQVIESTRLLEKASKLYYSVRIEEFSSILLLAVIQSDLNDQAKSENARLLKSIQQKSLTMVTASVN